MKKVSMLATASLSTLLAVAVATPAYAWHPQGKIVKTVQNQTAGTDAADANDAASAVSAAPGDTLVYTVTVSNNGQTAANGNNDMTGTKLTDTLPAGVELTSDPATKTISEDLGTITPGKSVTKSYTVKVTSTTDGDVITNKACFSGNSLVGDSAQNGCDTAVVKVKVPTQPTTPSTPTTPTTPSTPSTPTTPSTPESTADSLPNTGSTGLTAALVITGGAALGYGLNLMRLRRGE
jgi:uncharacterized repeat protein (TIGR01451 family)